VLSPAGVCLPYVFAIMGQSVVLKAGVVQGTIGITAGPFS